MVPEQLETGVTDENAQILGELDSEENQRTNEEKIGVKIELADGEKCERCWMYSTTVGEDKENPTICHKCSEALK